MTDTKNKTLMYIPQFSMSSGDKLFIDRDGNFIVLKTFLKLLKQYDGEYSVKVLLPSYDQIEQSVFYSDIEAITKDSNIKVDYVEFGWDPSPIINRYSFDAKKWRNILQFCDAVINNIPEIARNLRAVLGSRYIPIVSFHHFPDHIHENKLVDNWKNGNLFSYYWRQLDGMISSDINVFNCKSSLLGWKESIRRGLNGDLGDTLAKSDKLTHLSYIDLDDYRTVAEDKFIPYTAIFPARITESLYTNWQKVISLFSVSQTMGRVILCNPSGQKGIDVLANMGYLDDFYQTKLEVEGELLNFYMSRNEKIWISPGLSKREYALLCSKAQAALCLYEHERYGGIAIREVVGYGNAIPICLDKYECSNWYKGIGTKFPKTPRDLTPEKYNSIMGSCYLTLEHAQILQNFRNNEHYMNYSPNFDRIARLWA